MARRKARKTKKVGRPAGRSKKVGVAKKNLLFTNLWTLSLGDLFGTPKPKKKSKK